MRKLALLFILAIHLISPKFTDSHQGSGDNFSNLIRAGNCYLSGNTHRCNITPEQAKSAGYPNTFPEVYNGRRVELWSFSLGHPTHTDFVGDHNMRDRGVARWGDVHSGTHTHTKSHTHDSVTHTHHIEHADGESDQFNNANWVHQRSKNKASEHAGITSQGNQNDTPQTEGEVSQNQGDTNGDGGGETQDTAETSQADTDTQARTATPVVSRTPRPTHEQVNILRITHVSFAEVWGRGRVRLYSTLTIELTAVAPETEHNGLVILVNRQAFPTPLNFFGADLMDKGDVRTVELVAHPRNNAVSLKVPDPKNRAWLNNNRAGWQTIEAFDIDDFTIALMGKDTVTHADIDTDGNRIGYTAGAPSLIKPKLTTMWATLKKQNVN